MGILDRVKETLEERKRRARDDASIEVGYHKYRHPTLSYITTGERPPSYDPGYELRRQREDRLKAARRERARKAIGGAIKKVGTAARKSFRESKASRASQRPPEFHIRGMYEGSSGEALLRAQRRRSA